MLALWRLWWKNHGTKIYGYGQTGVGMLAYLDHETVKAVESFAGPVWGPRFTFFCVIAAGAGVAKRGYRNSKDQPP